MYERVIFMNVFTENTAVCRLGQPKKKFNLKLTRLLYNDPRGSTQALLAFPTIPGKTPRIG